jgi:hypothetical protein
MDLSEQRSICKKYGAHFVESPSNFKVGISFTTNEYTFPINGLRHPMQGETTGWYIWAGEKFSEDPDFFVPLHIEHLKDFCPEVIKYLGLSPGWRFLIGPNGYEDVWNDETLLKI